MVVVGGWRTEVEERFFILLTLLNFEPCECITYSKTKTKVTFSSHSLQCEQGLVKEDERPWRMLNGGCWVGAVPPTRSDTWSKGGVDLCLPSIERVKHLCCLNTEKKMCQVETLFRKESYWSRVHFYCSVVHLTKQDEKLVLQFFFMCVPLYIIPLCPENKWQRRFSKYFSKMCSVKQLTNQKIHQKGGSAIKYIWETLSIILHA